MLSSKASWTLRTGTLFRRWKLFLFIAFNRISLKEKFIDACYFKQTEMLSSISSLNMIKIYSSMDQRQPSLNFFLRRLACALLSLQGSFVLTLHVAAFTATGTGSCFLSYFRPSLLKLRLRTHLCCAQAIICGRVAWVNAVIQDAGGRNTLPEVPCARWCVHSRLFRKRFALAMIELNQKRDQNKDSVAPQW